MSNGSFGLFGGAHSSDGSIQSLYNLLDPGNIMGKSNSGDIAANFLDPGNLFGMNPAADPTLNGQAPNSNAANVTLPRPSGNVHPIMYDPDSFVARQPTAPGQFNAMVAALAGPQYAPRLLQQRKAATAPRPQVPQAGNGGMTGAMPTRPYMPQPMGRLGNARRVRQ
jgi:hypothetical protein